MSAFKYGSSGVGSIFLPLVAKMMNGDEKHQYSWNNYLDSLCACCFNSLKTVSSDDTNMLSV